MLCPAVYPPDPTLGITDPQMLPAPKVVRRSRNYPHRPCPKVKLRPTCFIPIAAHTAPQSAPQGGSGSFERSSMTGDLWIPETLIRRCRPLPAGRCPSAPSSSRH